MSAVDLHLRNAAAWSALSGQATCKRGSCRSSPRAFRKLDSAVHGVVDRASGLGAVLIDVGEVSKPTILTGALAQTRVRTGA